MNSTSTLSISEIALRNILFATDLSPSSLLALPFAASIARHYGGKVLLAHVLPDEDYESVPLNARAVLNRLETGAEEGIVSALGTLRDVNHEILMDHGSVRSKLLAVAEKCGVDLIVLGSHGWHGIKKLLRGSTAEEIACAASRPVLIVGPHVSSRPTFSRILYETDFSPMSSRALQLAFSLTEAYDASLLCLHVNDWDSKEPPVAAAPKTLEFFHQNVRAFGGGRLAEKCEARVEFGSRAERILHVAAVRGVNLIIMGLRNSKGIRARIAAHLPGSPTFDVVAEATCPVLTVPLTG